MRLRDIAVSRPARSCKPPHFWAISSVITLAVLMLLAAGGACTPASDGYHGALVRYGGQYYPEEFLLYGWPEVWSEYGIDVQHTLFSSGAESNEALIAGQVDINCGADSRTVALFTAIRDDALIIGTVQKGDRYVTVVSTDSQYHSWSDLVGKTVATRLGTGAEGVLRKFYEREGYDWEDFDYVNLKVEDMIAALERGQIEAFTAWEPTPAIAEANGIGRVLRTYGDVAPVPASLHTTRDFAYGNEDTVVRFLAAHLAKAALIESDPSRAAILASQAAAQRGITVSAEAFESAFARIDFSIDFDDATMQAIDETASFLYGQGKIVEVPVLSWDKSFLEKAQALVDQS